MAALSTCFGAAAQSPHSGYFLENIPNRHELNPSLTPDFNYASFLGLPLGGMMTIGLNSNVGAETFLFSRNDELVTGLHESVSSEEFLGKLKKNNYLEANLRLNILSFGFKKWGGFNTFNLNVRSTTGFNLPRELFEFAKIGQEDGAPASYDLSSIGVSTTNYVEFAFGHSRQITDKLRAGAKFKYLAGVAAADFSLDRMDVNMSGDRWSIRESGQLFTTNVVDILYNQNGEIDDFELDAGRLGVAGNGIGFDFGASYQLLDNLTLSASLTDIGFITWKGSTATANPDEFVFDGLEDRSTGVTTLDVAKRLLDYGFHAPTVYFPLLFHQSIMIEPTETESLETLDAFIGVMRKIAREAVEDPDMVKSAPHNTPVRRPDETEAARHPVLKFTDNRFHEDNYNRCGTGRL